ncbi:Calmodulin-binding transcription activator 3 [Acorus calamus]|uniref:Calmodulin-binding transcription activator 3 n=1 Tax=Acorus calamus TaxID=4465 RepID=A0AAV9DQR3_ACOCL|nr:Calmodulin-binding transcription activator 3 [Acorus calamus]
MAEIRRYGLTPQLDIEQILVEAQTRWLRPAEICEILRNYRKFQIAPEPPYRPSSGSLFLFDRKVLRYFRKDGHNWRKKKDGKTVKEAHERLKAGSVDVLHCYYAHGEENENFQRRSYWMLEEELMHIVLVHYREVKGNKASSGRARDIEEISPDASMNNPIGFNFLTNNSSVASQTMDTASLSVRKRQNMKTLNLASSRYHSLPELQQFEDRSLINAGLQNSYFPVSSSNNPCNYEVMQTISPGLDFVSVQENVSIGINDRSFELSFQDPGSEINGVSWEEDVLKTIGFQSSYELSDSVAQPANSEDITTSEVVTPRESFTDDLVSGTDFDAYPEGRAKWQLLTDSSSKAQEEGLKKFDSFSRWMSKELGEVDDTHIRSTSEVYWDIVESESQNVIDNPSLSHEGQFDSYVLSPSLSQDQLFSIIDFSPNWACTGTESKVLITGTFLTNKVDAEKIRWSCMFGELEVPAEVLGDGILLCHAPLHRAGRVPFYVTCSNRLACSEVREFEYRVSHAQYINPPDSCDMSTEEIRLHIRLDMLLSLGSADDLKPSTSLVGEKRHMGAKISSLLRETNDEWYPTSMAFSPSKTKDHLLQKILKMKLHNWLLLKIAEDGKGPNVLDEEGQGALHLAAALGYDWAIAPIVAAGVNINFRDVHGWTALHWAAFCGRERTVVALVSLDGAAGSLTDPTPTFPSGRTPADLASGNGHKGIAGYLAEISLTSHLSKLTLKESTKDHGVAKLADVKSFEDISDQSALQLTDTAVQGGVKDSLSAVRIATQAAARIHEVYRVHSFHRKQLIEYGNDKLGMSDERALSLIAVKSQRGQHGEPVHAAAIRIQNKFRGWKGRKEFLIIRQKIVKIQALVRGHQVRKQYKKVVWSVGIVEKAILRWRRKGCGLRGFRSEGLIEGPSMQNKKDDEYDFLKAGRKQAEERFQKALARVKSMVQYPEARDQYQRMLNAGTEFELTSKTIYENFLRGPDGADEDDDLIDFQELLGEEDDTYMPTA